MASYWGYLKSVFARTTLPTCSYCPLSEGLDSSPHATLADRRGMPTWNMVTGTMYGSRKGKALRLCLEESKSESESQSQSQKILLMVELSLSMEALLEQMQLGGAIQVSLRCTHPKKAPPSQKNLLTEDTWHMYLNGRKVGFAMQRGPSEGDHVVLQMLQPICVGAGVMPLGHMEEDCGAHLGHGEDDEIAYLRANYQRVVESHDSESFHVIEPQGLELSIALLRS